MSGNNEVHAADQFFVWSEIHNGAKGYSCLCNSVAKQKHLGCKKVRGQSEATLQTGRRDQNV